VLWRRGLGFAKMKMAGTQDREDVVTMAIEGFRKALLKDSSAENALNKVLFNEPKPDGD
jgi:3-hydroxy-3-methylglutaryl CoA synthase